MSAKKSSTGHHAPSIAEVLAGRERDEKGRIPQVWTIKKALAESEKFKTRKEFRTLSNSAYQYLIRKNSTHLMSFSTEIKRHRLSDFDVICAIKSCQTRDEMRKRFSGEHSAASKRKHLSVIFNDHFGRGKTNRYWSKEKVMLVAKDYSSRSDFCYENAGAYDYAMNNGFLDEACAHMESLKSDYDSVYMWCANGVDVYKVGVTSQRLGEWRIGNVSKKSGLNPSGLIIVKSNRALEAEKKLMKIGISANLSDFNGSSEFRIFSDVEYQEAYGVIYEYAD